MTGYYTWWTLLFVGTAARVPPHSSAGGSTLLSSKIEIEQGPAELVGELTHHGALFGRNFFGETIKNQLYYTKRSLCNEQLPDTPDYIKQDGYFLLVDRGECSFVEKVRNAQRDGATAVFIADDRCLCSANGLCETEADVDCEKIEPVMDDDGSGSDIKIPSMLLLKSDADRLRDEIVSGSVIETSISFPVPKAMNGRTEYMLFTTPDDHLSHQFLDSFLEAALSFGKKAIFEPRMLLTDGTEKGCRQYDDSHVPCKGYCTNYGRYCESPSVYDQERYEEKGTKIIVESMRRACIWNIYGKVDGVGKEWWAYVQLWTLQCSFSQYSASCAESVYDIAGVDKEEVEICMENSGNFREDVLNTLMETSLSDIAKYQVKFGPTLVVNGAIINGALNFGNAMKAICSTFEDPERPEICGKWDICSNACSNDDTYILWGENQECSEYKAPYLSNAGKTFDDDYLLLEIDDEAVIRPETPNVQMNSSTEMATKPLMKEDTNTMEDQTDIAFETKYGSPADINSTISNIQDVGITNSPIVSDPQYISPTSGATHLNTAGTNMVKDEELMYSNDGQHEFLETIQIYEGSKSDLAIGLGLGFCSAFLLVFIYLLISRERERQMEDFRSSGRIPGRIPRRGLFKSRQRYYNHDSNCEDQFSEDDEFSDEEDYDDDGVQAINHYHSARREQDRLFPQHSGRRSRMMRFRERMSHEKSSDLKEQKIPHIKGRVSHVRKMISEVEFSSDDNADNHHNPRMLLGRIDNGNNNNDKADRCLNGSQK